MFDCVWKWKSENKITWKCPRVKSSFPTQHWFGQPGPPIQLRSTLWFSPASVRRCTCEVLPFFMSSTSTLMTPPSFVALVTLVLTLNFNPCFVSKRCSVFAASRSMPTPPMLARNSTRVTSVPSRCHTEPCRPRRSPRCHTSQSAAGTPVQSRQNTQTFS